MQKKYTDLVDTLFVFGDLLRFYMNYMQKAIQNMRNIARIYRDFIDKWR